MITKTQRIYLILGMHRAGTSALTSVLAASGLPMGKHLLEPSFDNPKGFFENKLIINFNERLLRTLEMKWDSPLILPENWENYLNLDALRKELEEIILNEFDDHVDILIKDPRLCLILPIWKSLLTEVDFVNIIITRSPDQISKSLLARNKIGQDKSNIIWLNHYLQVEQYTKSEKRIFVDFQRLQKNTKKECERLMNFLANDNLVLDKADYHLINNSHSSIKGDNSEQKSNQLSELADTAYTAMLKMGSHKSQKAEETIDHSRASFMSFYHQFIDSVMRKDDKLFTFIFLDKAGRRNKVLQQLNIGGNNFHFRIEAEDHIETLIVLPSNDKTYFRLDCLELKNNGEKISIKKENSAVLFEHGIEYVVNNRSYFQYTLSKAHTSFDVEVTMEIFSIGINTMDSLDVLSTKVNTWINRNLNTLKKEQQKVRQVANVKTIELQEFKDELNQTMNKLEAVLQQKNLVENQYDILKKKNADFAQKIKNREHDILEKDKLVLELQMKTSEFNQLKTNLLNREAELDNITKEMKKANDTLQKQYSESINQLTQSNKKELEIEILKLKAIHLEEKYKIKIDQLEQTVKVLEERCATLSTENKSQDKLALRAMKLELQLENLQAKVKEESRRYDQIAQDANKIQSELHNKEKEVFHWEQLSNQFLEERDQVQSQITKSTGIDEGTILEFFDYLETTNTQSVMQSELEATNQEYYELKTDLERILAEQNTEINNKDGLIESLKDQINQAAHMIGTKEAALERNESIIREQRKELLKYKVDYTNINRDMSHVKESISYKVGSGITSPARWVYDKVSGKTPLNKSRLWLIKNLIIAGINNPIAAVMNLNPKNLRTLHHAMQSESNETIISNFSKLVDDEAVNQIDHAEPQNGEYNGVATHLSQNKIDTEVATIEESSNVIHLDDVAIDNVERPKVMYISPNLPDYDTSSGGKRATRMIEMLCEQFDVFVFTYGARPQKYVDKLSSIGAIVIQGNDYSQIKRRIPVINTLIFAWYYSYNDANKLVQLYNDAKIIVDSVDVHWVREERSVGLVEGLTEDKVASNKRKEIAVYEKADIVWTVTENDKQFILDAIPEMQVDVVSNIHDNHVHQYEDRGTNKMLFFGGFNHYPNISAAKNIVEHILPLVRKEIPDAELILAGANATEEIESLGTHEGVDFRGFIEEEDLPGLYDESYISVAPLLAGAGIKGKICESIVYRTPVATNAIGNEGIHMENLKDGLIAEENEELANLIVRAMNREFDMNHITHNAQEILKDIVGTETVKRKMFGSIMPEVSICIVTWNRLDLLKRCIESIEGNTIYPYYKILVHSNGCTDGTQQYLEAAASINKKIVPILSQENEVFVIPNNNMMQMFPANDSVLVNNDVYVTKGWLMELYKAAYGNPKIGIAGSKILYPDQSLQEFGSELYDDGTGRNIGKHDDPNKNEYKQLQRVGYVSGCSMYIKKKTIEKIGVFDLQFHPCYCEDSDYCYTAWENEIETVVTPNSIIYHDEGGTSGTDEDSGFKAYQKVNFEKFLAKHKENLQGIGEKIKSLN